MRKYKVENMGCGKCAQKIMEALSNIELLDEIEVSTEEKTVSVSFNGDVNDELVIDTLSNIDFEAKVV